MALRSLCKLAETDYDPTPLQGKYNPYTSVAARDIPSDWKLPITETN
jgi:hypothetical protein